MAVQVRFEKRLRMEDQKSILYVLLYVGQPRRLESFSAAYYRIINRSALPE